MERWNERHIQEHDCCQVQRTDEYLGCIQGKKNAVKEHKGWLKLKDIEKMQSNFEGTENALFGNALSEKGASSTVNGIQNESSIRIEMKLMWEEIFYRSVREW